MCCWHWAHRCTATGSCSGSNELTAGRVALGAGTLYGALTNLTEKGWIRPLPGAAEERKKEYVITDAGRA